MGKKNKRLKASLTELEEFIAEVKGAAAEADVNVVHNLINQGIKIKVGSQVMLAKQLAARGKLEDAGFEIDEKTFTMGMKWCAQNQTVMTPEESKEIKKGMDELDSIANEQRGRTLRAVGD